MAQWEEDLGWAKPVVAGAFTASLLSSALVAPAAGHLIDKGPGRLLMVGGSSAGGAALLLLSFVQRVWQFYAAWVLLGVAMATCLYDPCFSYLLQREAAGGPPAKRAIVRVSLCAGFAGPLSFPLANAVANAYDWRVAVRTFAAMSFACAPIFFVGAAPIDVQAGGAKEKPSGGFCASLRLPAVWLLALSFSLFQGSHMVIITHLLTMLDELGVATALAVLVISLIGPSQVFGRVVMVMVERWVSYQFVFGLCCFGQGCAQLCLVAVASGAARWLLFVAVALQGASAGVYSIVRPTITKEILAERWSAAISGAIASVSAAAPLASSCEASISFRSVLPSIDCRVTDGWGCTVAARRLLAGAMGAGRRGRRGRLSVCPCTGVRAPAAVPAAVRGGRGRR